MSETKYTPQQIMAAKPCEDYDLEQVTELWAGRDTLTPREMSELDIPVDDRLWALIYVCMDDRQARLFACDQADALLAQGDDPDPRIVNAVTVARRHAVGDATDEELRAAGYAAKYAAWNTAGYVAWSAARDAAGYAARNAAWNAAWSAQIKSALENLEGENE